MTASDKVQQLFAGLGASLGFDEMGNSGVFTYRLNYDGGLSVNVDYIEGTDNIMLVAPMFELQGQGSVDAYLDLLELNLYWDELAGGRFALLGEQELIVFIRQLDINKTTQDSFVDDVQAFIDVAGVWNDTFHGRYLDEDVGADENAESGFMKV